MKIEGFVTGWWLKPPGPSWTQPRQWRWHILLPAMAWLTSFSFMFYVRSWPTSSPLTSIHIISHNCHSPPCFWTVESTPDPLQVCFQSCWTPHIRPPLLPVSTVLLAKASHQITCYVQSQQQSDAAICWGHTCWEPVEWLAFWWPLWQLTLGCAAVLGQSVMPCCCVIRLVGCRQVFHGAQGCKMFLHL